MAVKISRPWALRLPTLVTLGWGLLSGCGTLEEPSKPLGKLALPLAATAASGTRYRLVTGTFDIAGTEQRQLAVADEDADSLEVSLRDGDYTVSLFDWQLARVEQDVLTPVLAELITIQPQSFSVITDATTTVAFQFRVPGGDVQLGSGTVRFVIDVEESAPALCRQRGSDASVSCLDTVLDESPPQLTTFQACVPAISQAGFQLCASQQCSEGVPGCPFTFTTDPASLTLSDSPVPRALDIGMTLPPIELMLPVSGGINCSLQVNTLNPTPVAFSGSLSTGGNGVLDVSPLATFSSQLMIDIFGCGELGSFLPLLTDGMRIEMLQALGEAVRAALTEALDFVRCEACETGCGLACSLH